MSSILTNNSAMTALQTLKGINRDLSMTQSQISTGKKVATASDNAATWAISKTMESDTASFNKLSEGLSVASSTVGVARDATETITGLLRDMKEKAVQAASATTTAADRQKIDAGVQALREQIGSVVDAAQFNGVNLINGTKTGDMEVLSSLDRAGNGNVTQSTIGVAYQDLSESNAATAASLGGTAVTDKTIADNGGGAAGTAKTIADGASNTFTINSAGDGVGYKVTLDGGSTNFKYVANKNDSTADVARKLGEQLTATYGSNANYTIGQSGNEITVTNTSGGALDFNINTSTGGTAATAAGLGALQSIDVVNDATGALDDIDAMISYAIDASAEFGTAQNQLDTQNDFLGKLTDNVEAGIGALVDTNMEEASARLQALQTQQQLSTQSLSIANAQSQNILALFRG